MQTQKMPHVSLVGTHALYANTTVCIGCSDVTVTHGHTTMSMLWSNTANILCEVKWFRFVASFEK